MEIETKDIKYVKDTRVSLSKDYRDRHKNANTVNGETGKNMPTFAARTSVPKAIFEAMGLKEGDRICWIMLKNGVVTITKGAQSK